MTNYNFSKAITEKRKKGILIFTNGLNYYVTVLPVFHRIIL
jgi:hypothetical protein